MRVYVLNNWLDPGKHVCYVAYNQGPHMATVRMGDLGCH
jgi:hypothetical protein